MYSKQSIMVGLKFRNQDSTKITRFGSKNQGQQSGRMARALAFESRDRFPD